MSLFDFANRLPAHLTVVISREKSEDGEEFFLCATIQESPPTGGWRTGCEYFGHVPAVHSEDAPCGWRRPVPQWKSDSCPRWSVTATTAEDLEKLLVGMMSRWFIEKGAAER